MKVRYCIKADRAELLRECEKVNTRNRRKYCLMILSVDKNSFVPVYEQIDFAVKAAIASGRVRANEQLPSIREIATQLEVNPNTVAKTFRTLELLGCVYTRKGTGIFISDGAQALCKAECERFVLDLVRVGRNSAIVASLDWEILAKKP